MAGLGFRDDCRQAFQERKILTLPSLYILECCLYCHDNRDSYAEAGQHHGHATRQANALFQPTLRLTTSRNAPNYWCIKIYNKIVSEEKATMSRKQLKFKLKKLLLQNAFYSVEEACLTPLVLD